MLPKHGKLISIGLVLIASVRIAATYTVFNHTTDEPIHIACGMEWLDRGVYQLEAQHPPLARVASAIGPYLLGLRYPDIPKKDVFSMTLIGNAILYRSQRYDLALAVARLGILPFFWIACLVVYQWGRRFSPAAAVVAVGLFSFLPTVLAHAAVATTDMALAAFLGAAFLCGSMWLETPNGKNALLFGASAGLMVLSKFSGLIFFPAVAALALAWYGWRFRPRPAALAAALRARAPGLAVAVLAGVVVIWAGYRFSFGRVDFAAVSLPAPELYQGVEEVRQHNAAGHYAYLLGQRSTTGFWHYYPVALAYKTPIGFLLLLAIGVFVAIRERGKPYAGITIAFAAGILLVGAFSRINIGVRHVLPVYLAFSVLAAVAVVRIWESRVRAARALLLVPLVWFAASSVFSHPDYLAYFNEFAGGEPEKILVDSDLDWGQDVKRLAARLGELGATEVTFAHGGIIESEKEHGMPRLIRRMDVNFPNPGWTAVSLTLLKAKRFGLSEQDTVTIPWPERYQPVERVGKSILLYYVSPTAIPAR